MKKYLNNFIRISTLAILMFGFSTSTFAVAPLGVEFTPNPLFNEGNFLPTDTTEGTVKVTNNTETTQTIQTEAVNVYDPDGFGSQLFLTIEDEVIAVYADKLSNFFSIAGEVELGDVEPGESRTFKYTVAFINSNDNTYQGKTLGFDICVGFKGGSTNCGTTVVGDENPTDNPGDDTPTNENPTNPSNPSNPSNPGGGGGGIAQTPLEIYNEKANISSEEGVLVPDTTALITWDTNKLATSQVVYGLEENGPYTFDINNVPAFGYPLVTIEDPTKVIHHSVLLTGLTPGKTYLFRVVSRASPATVSYEREFIIPVSADNPVTPNNPTYPTGGGTNGNGGGNTGIGGAVLALLDNATQTFGNDDQNDEINTTTANEEENFGKSLAGASIFGDFDLLSNCTYLALLILLALYILSKYYSNKKYKAKGLPPNIILQKFLALYSVLTALSVLVAYAIGEYCPIPVFTLAFIITVCAYLYKKRN